MTYHGRIENGVVVLEPGATLPEGMQVRVEPLSEQEATPENTQDLRQLRQGLLGFSGLVKDGPTDLARNHDHYLHGTPRR